MQKLPSGRSIANYQCPISIEARTKLEYGDRLRGFAILGQAYNATIPMTQTFVWACVRSWGPGIMCCRLHSNIMTLYLGVAISPDGKRMPGKPGLYRDSGTPSRGSPLANRLNINGRVSGVV